MSDTEHSFDYFWKYVIYPAIKECSEDVDLDFSSETNLRHRNPNDYKIELEKTYKQKRAWLKSEYLPEEQYPSLDFHKLSAILCRCLIGNKYFTYNVKTAEKIQRKRKRFGNFSHAEELEWENNNLYINYKLAFLVGEGVAFYDMMFWAQSRINEDKQALVQATDENEKQEIRQHKRLLELFIEQLNKKELGLRPYFCSRTHDDFKSSMIVSLMKTDCLMRDFDYLMFGTIMFQWQEYSKRCIFSELVHQEFSLNNANYLNSWLQFCLQ